MNKNAKWDPAIDYAGIAARKRLKFKISLIVALVIIGLYLLFFFFRSYGDYCYERGAEAGVNHGYQLRKYEEDLKRWKETDSLRTMAQDLPTPMAL